MNTTELWSSSRDAIKGLYSCLYAYQPSQVPSVETIQRMLVLVRAANTSLQSLERQLVGVLPPKEG